MMKLSRFSPRTSWSVAAVTLLIGTALPLDLAVGSDRDEAAAPATEDQNSAESAVTATDAIAADREDSLESVLKRLAVDRAAGVADRTPASGGEIRPPEGDRLSQKPLKFSFRAQPWGDALQWLADEADFSLVADHPPTGTCNYVDRRSYTPDEAIDVFNRLLLVKGYTLVRRGRMLWLLNLEDKIPPKLLPTVTPEELDGRGEFELVNVVFRLDTVTPQEVLAEIEPLLGPHADPIPLEKSRRLQLTETAGRLRTIRDVIEAMDSPAQGSASPKTYLISRTSPHTLLPFLKSMLEDEASVKFSLDPASGNLIALASGEQHEVLRGLLIQLGESGNTVDSRLAARQNLRVIPLTAAQQRSAIQAIQQIYGSKLRMVTPSAVAPSSRDRIPADSGAAPADRSRTGPSDALHRGRLIQPRTPSREAGDPTAAGGPAENLVVARQVSALSLSPAWRAVRTANLQNETDIVEPDDQEEAVVPVDEPAISPGDDRAGSEQAEPQKTQSTETDSGLTVASTPRGIVVHSDDLELLDDVEALIRSFAGAAGGVSEHTFFFLRNAVAAEAVETVKNLIGSGPDKNADEETMSTGAGIYTGPPRIHADSRLNALIVKASPADLIAVEQLLQVIDQDGAPETQFAPRPRVIPVVYADVEAIEKIVKATFEPDIYAKTSGNRNERSRSPSDWIARMRGGGRGNDGGDGNRGGNGNNANDRQRKMTVTSDKVNNALIVSAPQTLYEEVLDLVEMLDVGTPATMRTARVVTLHRSSAQSVQGALSAMFGDSITARTAAASEESARNGSSNSSSRDEQRQREEDEQRRNEFRRRMMERFRGFGGSRGGDSSRGDRSRGGR